MTAWKTQTNTNEMRIVLIVSQDTKMVTVWESLYKQRSCYVVHETSPRNALRAAQLISPTLIILDLDLTLPERLALCRGLRPTTRGALFLLAAKVNKDEALKYDCAGVDEHLSTTISPASLMAKSMLWLTRQEATASYGQPEKIYT